MNSDEIIMPVEVIHRCEDFFLPEKFTACCVCCGLALFESEAEIESPDRYAHNLTECLQRMFRML